MGQHQRSQADWSQIVPGSSNHLAIELLVDHVKRQLDSRSLRFRKLLADSDEGSDKAGSFTNKENLVILEQTPQLRVRGFAYMRRYRD